jgi:sodium/proline symporter
VGDAAAILWTLVVYKLVMVGIGLWANQRSNSAEDFFLGGRALGPWVAALSASASSSSAWTLIGVSGFAFSKGLSVIWIFPACVGGFALNWYLLAPALRRKSAEWGSVTVSEVLAGPGGTRGRSLVLRVAAVIVLVSLVTYVASQFAGAGKTFEEVFGIARAQAVLIGATVVVLYTLLGGFWAVSVTDTLQGFLMAVSAVVLPVAGLWSIGGCTALMEAIAEVPVDGYASIWGPAAGPSAAAGMVLGLLGIGLGYPGQPHVVNRLMALRDEDALRKGRRIAMSWAVIVYSGTMVAGLCARVHLGELGDHENAFVALTSSLFPPVIAGVMIAAVLSAIMSTADSQLLVAASAVSHDLGLGSGVKEGDGAEASLWRSRVVVVFLSLVAVVVALYATQSIFDSVLFAWSSMGAAFGPVLLVTVVRGRPRAGAVLAAMLVGFTSAVLAFSFTQTRGGIFERVLPFLLAYAIAALAPRASDEA